MKFDLFDAMAHMRRNFGNKGEIILTQSEGDIRIRLRVVSGKKTLNSQFSICPVEIETNKVDIANYRFSDCIKKIKSILSDTLEKRIIDAVIDQDNYDK